MAAEQSPEAKELSLVGKVEMRIALADGDQKLQATLNTPTWHLYFSSSPLSI
jgi:proteasome component ECM29